METKKAKLNFELLERKIHVWKIVWYVPNAFDTKFKTIELTNIDTTPIVVHKNMFESIYFKIHTLNGMTHFHNHSNQVINLVILMLYRFGYAGDFLGVGGTWNLNEEKSADAEIIASGVFVGFFVYTGVQLIAYLFGTTAHKR